MLLIQNVLIMKVNVMHNFSNLFHIVLYNFLTAPLSIIRSISILNTGNKYICCATSVDCLLVRSGWNPLTTLADSQQNYHDKNLLHVSSVEIFLMMDSRAVRNM